MDILYIIYAAVAAGLLAFVWLDMLRMNLLAAGERRSAMLRESLLRAVTECDVRGGGFPVEPAGRRERMQLALVLSELGDKTDTGQHAGVCTPTEFYGLDSLLVRRARRTHGCRRALWLVRLSRLNPRREVVEPVRGYLASRNRRVRFGALLCLVAAEPLRVHQLTASFGHRLTHFELEQIIALIFRGRMPVACMPLLRSPHPNLRMLGIGIVRRIGAEETQPQLAAMAARDPDRMVCRAAFAAMCAMHLPMSGRETVQALSRMSHAERKSVCRLMAAEGYSAKAISQLFRERERRYFESLAGSYKSTLA
ncbi:MAG: HEAT repeat domain-containing protein [Alistipes sp.]|nr:HEAT repeat domain-containing protein [Alistipes sp.]